MPSESQPPISKADALETTSWASDFSWPELQTLARHMDLSRVTGGTVIIREGDQEAFMFIVLQGRVHVIKEDGEHNRKILYEICNGDTFGEMSIFDNEPRSATVVADQGTSMLILNREGLEQLIEETPALAARLLLKLGKIVSRRLRLTSGKLIDYLG